MQLSPGRARGAPRRHPGGHRRRGPQDDLLPRSQAARVLVVIDVVGEMLARVHVPPPLAVEKTPLMPVTRTARCVSNALAKSTYERMRGRADERRGAPPWGASSLPRARQTEPAALENADATVRV